jgi:spermidine synthase
MPDTAESWDHIKPFVYESPTSKALHFSMAFLLFNSRPDNVAMIGLGGGSLAKFCHRHLPASRIQVRRPDSTSCWSTASTSTACRQG